MNKLRLIILLFLGLCSCVRHGGSDAAVTQSILIAVIGVLLVFIFIAWLWWRERIGRIQKLYEQLLYKQQMLEKQQLIVAEPLQREGARYMALSGYKKAAVCEKNNMIKDEQELPPHYPLLYKKLNQIMKEKELFLDPDFELASLSQAVGMSRTIISNVLNRHAGTNFNDWLSEYRIHYLLEQMRHNSNLELNELYPKAGYTSRSTFFRQFRNVTGLTPLQYMSRVEYSSAV
ncbi:MAG: helix-turn-helix domain-containing protein [Bacteroidales bacterium]